MFLVVIFKGDKLKESWCIGLDIFAEEEGFGFGKRYPGGSSIRCGEKEVPVLFGVSENASMTSEILAETLREMDRLNISKRTEDLTPVLICDGHSSRIGLPFLSYVNGYDLEELKNLAPEEVSAFVEDANRKPRWMVELDVPYGTLYWQGHDNQALNGHFKSALSKEKSDLVTKKRIAGLPGEVENVEIITVIGKAANNSFGKLTNGKSAVAATGWNPPTMAALDIPDILQTAPKEIREERSKVLSQRGVDCCIISNNLIPSSERNLMNQGSGLMAGPERIAEAAATLNFSGATASEVFKMAETHAKR